jgi:ketosteroid isomerase-like protein
MASANVELIRSIFADWDRGDFTSAEWAHPEIEFVIADGPEPATRKGLAGLAEGWRGYLSALENLRIRAEDVREVDAECVLVLATGSGQFKRSGLDPGLYPRTAGVFYVSGGKVTRFVIYFDRDRAFVDLGLPPEDD